MVVIEVRQLNQKTDADLLKEFSGRGSHAAFATLVDRHGPMVHAVALRVVSNHHDAQDVTQAVFLALSRQASKLSDQPSVAGWLHTVSRNLALDARRSGLSRQRREQAAMKEEVNLTPDSTLSAGFRRELDSALALLPDRYRQPLVLFHLEGASLHEVAQRLDLEPSTLRTRLSRARDLLRQFLVRRGVKVASVGLLSSLFAAEAKAAAFPAAFLSTVLDTAVGSGSTVAPSILKLADKAASLSSSAHVSAITSLIILMKTKVALVSAAVLVLATIGTATYVLTQADDEPGKVAQVEGQPKLPRQTDSVESQRADGRKRSEGRKRAPQFQSLEEVEQALLDFNLTPIFGGGGITKEEEMLCLNRFLDLTDRIPESYYGQLIRRQDGPQMNLRQVIRQLALYRAWGRVNFEAALADLPNIKEGKAHSKALHNVFVGTMDADPVAAMKKAETFEIEAPIPFGETERIDLMDTLFDHWIESDPFSALEWAKQATVPVKRRDQWIADGLRAWSKTDPAAAAKWSKP